MHVPRRLALILAVALLATPLPARANMPVGGFGVIEAPHADQPAPGLEQRHAARAQKSLAGPHATLYPTFAWPLERRLRDGLVIVNYLDHDTSAAILDYSSGTHAYDGHTGTDIALCNFRLMDRGCRVLAAAPGTVTQMSTPTPYDRHCDFDWPDDGNWIEITHADGTYAYYLHMRSNSIVVRPGDAVQTGQMLGLVGSSGYSTGPHLHFEAGEYNGSYTVRDPFSGPSNPLPSLWQSQPDYVGDDPVWVADLGVFSQNEVGGSIYNTTYCDLQNGIPAPVVFGADEPVVGIWAQFQGRLGDVITFEVRRPDNSVYASFDDTLSFKARFDWMWVYWYWNPYVAPTDYGTWKVRTLVGGSLAMERPFTVAATTVYGPRFRPRGGRSFLINGTVQRDTLRRWPMSGPVAYSLLNAPPFVSLVNDSIVTVAATSSQPTRSRYFQAVMTDAAARRDTAWYHIVDLSKPLEPPLALAVPDPPAAGALELALAAIAPNPSAGASDIEFALPSRGPARVEVFDVAGRLRRTLWSGETAAGRQRVSWDGRDGRGRPCGEGVFFVRLSAAGRSVSRRVVRLD